ncbi:hypothetical protein ACFE04_015351 [Oxalis oulophora]
MISVNLQLLSNSLLCHRQREPPATDNRRHNLTVTAALTKQAERFISTLNGNKNTNLSINKFVSSSNKSISLNALTYLLSPQTSLSLSSLALPLYSRITQAPWFNFNPKLLADVIAFLDSQGKHEQSKILIFEAVNKLEFKERELICFYSYLIESQSKWKSDLGFSDSYTRISEFVSNSSSSYVRKQGFKAMVGGLCEMDRVREAEEVMDRMVVNGLKLSLFEFRSVLFGYGRLGLFDDMLRVVKQMENAGFELDVVSSNMVLASYGDRNAHSEMVEWLRRMKKLGVPFSIRTYNSVLNSCPRIMLMVKVLKSLPLSVEELIENLSGDEALLVKELVDDSCVLSEAMEWGTLEVKLDLHGMHLGSSYLIMLQWMEEMRNRYRDANSVNRADVTVVCGSGKHSSVRGESSVKGLVKWIMVQTKSPMRIDRKNIGCFVAKGTAVKDWLC